MRKNDIFRMGLQGFSTSLRAAGMAFALLLVLTLLCGCTSQEIRQG